jgi:hypothetical protein
MTAFQDKPVTVFGQPERLTRRAALRGALASGAALAMPAGALVIPAAALAAQTPVAPPAFASLPDHPWVKARRLASELSDTLEQIEGGAMMALIEASSSKFPVLFADREAYYAAVSRPILGSEAAVKRALADFKRAAMAFDPTITSMWVSWDEGEPGEFTRLSGAYFNRKRRSA